MLTFFIDKSSKYVFKFDWQVFLIIPYLEVFFSSVNLFSTTRLSRGFLFTKKELKPWRLEFFDLKLFGKTGSFDALNEVFLSKEEDDEEGEYHEDGGCIVEGLLLNKLGNALSNIAYGVGKNYHVRHKHVIVGCVGPLPGK